ncbi:MAG: 50S ribosomal protein L27 [Patescibacteria group bacterium]
MASTKAGGSTKNVRDSKPKYLGIKLGNGAAARPGMVIVRQRGTKIMAGKNVRVGKDHTLFSMTTGKVSYTEKRKMKFDGSVSRKKVANVI